MDFGRAPLCQWAGNVTTRVYDQNGNDMGSERNSRTEAGLKGGETVWVAAPGS